MLKIGRRGGRWQAATLNNDNSTLKTPGVKGCGLWHWQRGRRQLRRNCNSLPRSLSPVLATASLQAPRWHHRATAQALDKRVNSAKVRVRVGYHDTKRRCPVYEECLRSVAAKRDGTYPAGKRSGSAAAGCAAAFRGKRERIGNCEALAGHRGWRTANRPNSGSHHAERSASSAGTRRRMGRHGQTLALSRV